MSADVNLLVAVLALRVDLLVERTLRKHQGDARASLGRARPGRG